jgi:hypothetical protein
MKDDDDCRERELSVDELELVTGTGAILPLTQYAGQPIRLPRNAHYGVCDDSV